MVDPHHVTDTRLGGFEAVALENAHLRAVIIPELGGRVWELEDRVRRRQWIWHRDDVALRAVPPGTAYDEVWAGGWEELFPNDAPGRFEERDLPDHGEWWTLAWTRREVSDPAVVRLSATSTVVRASLLKEFRLDPRSGTMSVSYEVRSDEPRGFHFLFKQHLPVQLSPACRLRLPGGRVHPVSPSFSTLLADQGPFDWPTGIDRKGGVVDLQTVPGRSSGLQEFIYVRDLSEPWCEVLDRDRGARLRLSFDAEAFPFIWLFMSYGGWRDSYTVVLEPCSNMPKDLSEAVRLGQSAYLGPGETFQTRVTLHLGGLDDENP